VASYSSAQHTVFTVINYDSYQEGASEVASEGQTRGNKQECKNDKKSNNVIYQQIADEWNASFTELPNVKKVTQKRKSHINALINEFGKSHRLDDIDRWKDLFEYIRSSDFLMGRKGDWRCDFDFIINKNNMLKIIEGKYENTRA